MMKSKFSPTIRVIKSLKKIWAPLDQTHWTHVDVKVAENQSRTSYFVLQVLRAAGVHVELQQFGQHVGRGHCVGVLRGVVSYLTDGPGRGCPDVVLSLLGEDLGQLGHPLQDGRNMSYELVLRERLWF